IWAISSENNDKIALVDPGDALVCIEYLQTNNLMLTAILITHHHSDHVGGIAKLL
ncbi:MAG TPA: hydroxyacylglutathione hydrolase, partial [Colwellia sp.]|nr:hydroxyacylglutathione hydrolase [Colwellia sp.]